MGQKEIIGYHGTFLSSSRKILRDGYELKPQKNTDDYWIGHGIYFYEEYDLAKWWATQKVKKFKQKYKRSEIPSVIKSTIIADSKLYLNLDNRIELKKFFAFCREKDELLKSLGYELSSNNETTDEVELKRVRCFLLDIYKEENGIIVVSYTFSRNYPSYIWNKKELGQYIYLGLVFKELQVCVTDSNFISKSSLLYPEEVII